MDKKYRYPSQPKAYRQLSHVGQVYPLYIILQQGPVLIAAYERITHFLEGKLVKPLIVLATVPPRIVPVITWLCPSVEILVRYMQNILRVVTDQVRDNPPKDIRVVDPNTFTQLRLMCFAVYEGGCQIHHIIADV